MDLLDHVEGFKFTSSHFESLGLPINDPTLINLEASDFDFFKEKFLLLKHEMTKGFALAEAGIRVYFWDQIILRFFSEVSDDSKDWAMRSELVLQEFMNLDCERRVDIGLIMTVYENVVLFCEIGENKFNDNISHKDFAKINSMLTISCIRLAKKLKSLEFDPTVARSFGILIGDTGFQLAVAHPVLTPIDGTDLHEIRVDVSVNPHWFIEFGKSESSSSNCSDPCCISSDLKPLKKITKPGENIPKHPTTEEALKFAAEEGFEFDEDVTMSHCASASMDDETLPDYVGMVEKLDLENASDEINESAVAKFAIFMNLIKNYIKNLKNLKKVDPDILPKFEPPNLAYVPVASRGSSEDTPAGKQILSVSRRSELGINSSPSNNIYRATGKKSKESTLYMTHLCRYFCFPRVFGKYQWSHNDIDIKFEKMVPLMKNGIFGPYGEGNLFHSIVRADSSINLILDACTYAVHVLFGLDTLHKSVGQVHSDISPENILYSAIDDMWKINDFQSSLPIEESKMTPRVCGTKGFTSPESLKTGIFTESSDIYALGMILWKIFHVQIMFMISFEEGEDQNHNHLTQKAYDDFVEAVAAMIQDCPNDRPSAIKSMEDFNRIIKNNQRKSFRIYGSDRLMITVDNLIEEYQSGKEATLILDSSELNLQRITTNVQI